MVFPPRIQLDPFLRLIGAGEKSGNEKRLYLQPFYVLPDQDSNLDKQNQNLSYYHYTIGQTFIDRKGVTFLLTLQIYADFSFLQIKSG